MKEYTLNHIRVPVIIYGIFLKEYTLDLQGLYSENTLNHVRVPIIIYGIFLKEYTLYGLLKGN